MRSATLCFRRRAFTLVSKLAPPLLALIIGLPQLANATSCEVSLQTGEIGSFFGTQSQIFDELESITTVSVNEVAPPALGLFEYQCSPFSYSFEGNQLTVFAGCKASFNITGRKKDCDDAVPESGISQVPLFLSQSAPPNVMYILDDSGSMQFELMPGELIRNNARFLYPRIKSVYGGRSYDNRVVTFDSSSAFNRMSRSPQLNTVYYNPAITYRPWLGADGSEFPQANPRCALHNPVNSGSGRNICRDLAAENDGEYFIGEDGGSWRECPKSGGCSSDNNANKRFWPAVYYWFNGNAQSTDDQWDTGKYEKVVIKNFATSNNEYVGHGRVRRSDCADAENATCTYAEEIQNFANWYTYYRSRVLTARAGSGRAFALQGGGLRVGFGSLNSESRNVDDEPNTKVIRKGVRAFSGDDRQAFYDELYGIDIPDKGTPLREALSAAGEYFQRDDDQGPWNDTPGESGGDDLECRRNYTVLMTDGYWSNGDLSGDPFKNNDGKNNPTHTASNGASYTYKAVSPFKDDRSDTLADVAMYYWKNDLRSDLPNAVTINKKNPAFWQHMTTFGVGLGVSGTIDPEAAFAALTTGTAINWPSPTSDDLHKIDDLLHAAVNSRGQFFSANNPDEFAQGLSDSLQTIANESKSSASAVAANSTRLDSGTLVYQASFNSLEWTGRIVAYKVQSDGSLGDIKWDSDKSAMPTVASRNLFAATGDRNTITADAINFSAATWTDLSAQQRATLKNGGTDDDGRRIVRWVRGEQLAGLRRRTSILGDIVNSDPVFIGNRDDYGFHTLSGSEGSTYRDFLKTKKSWDSIIVVGANDGMLHGFDAETGKEIFGFVPVSSFSGLVQLADPNYEHRYFVDGSPRASDAYINGSWTTVAVGATGAGGRSVFAVDVSNPAAISQNNFLWEFATPSDASDKLGVAMSEPTIIRVAAGNKWVAIFGNGYESGDTVKLMVVDLATGSLIKAIDTEVSGEGNGLGSPVPVDIDNDRITDYVYAGDLNGNLWKFDLTGSNSNQWKVAFKSGSTPAPLFNAVDDDGNPQPITMRPIVGRHPAGGYYVYFGTGKYFETSDATVGDNPQLQDFYGIRDAGSVVDRDNLLVQDVFFENIGTNKDSSTTDVQVRLVSSNGADVPEYGWRLPLQPPDDRVDGERAVSRPLLRNGRVIFTTLIPTDNICGFGGRSWLMELDAYTGGRYADPVLDTNNDGLISALDTILFEGEYYPISGRGSDEIIKTPGVISKGSLEYKYTSGSSGTVGVITEKGDDGGDIGRQSWRQLQ